MKKIILYVLILFIGNICIAQNTKVTITGTSTGGTGGISEVVADYGLLNVNDSTLKVDSSLILTKLGAAAIYQTILTFSTGLTNTAGTVTANLSTGISGGQSVIGGTASGNNLTLSSTTHATKGKIIFGTSSYDESKNTMVLGGTWNQNEVAGDAGHLWELINDSTQYQLWRMSSYGAGGIVTGSNNMHFFKARGRLSAPAAVQSGDDFMSMGFRGWSTSSTPSMAAFQVIATENWTASANGTKFHFEATPTGTATRLPIMDITGLGVDITGILKTQVNQNNETYSLVDNTNTGGSAAQSSVIVANNFGANNNYGRFKQVGTGQTGTTLTNLSNSTALYSGGSGGLIIGSLDNTAKMRFFTGGNATANERLTILGDGTVGIGTTTPIVNTAYGNMTLNGSTGGMINFTTGNSVAGRIYSTTSITTIETRAATPMTFGINTSEAWRVDVNKNWTNTVGTGTAYIHLKAGTATASTAPLKFTAGVVLTTPVSGNVETDASNDLYYTNSTDVRARVGMWAYIAKTGTYTATNGDYTIDCTANTFTVTLPATSGISGRIYVIKNTGTGVITIDANASELIDGALTQTLSTQYSSYTLQSTGSAWIIL